MREVLQGKIHGCTITSANKEYIGSISICPKLIKLVDFWENQKVLVANLDTGHRFETYVIYGKNNEICVNGAAANNCKVGEKLIIMGFKYKTYEIEGDSPKCIMVDDTNTLKQWLSGQ